MILPAGIAAEARLLLVGRALRAFCDGFVAILLPAYLVALGMGTWEIGVISTARLSPSDARARSLGASLRSTSLAACRRLADVYHRSAARGTERLGTQYLTGALAV